MNRKTEQDDIMSLYGESAHIEIPPAEVPEDAIRNADPTNVVDAYFSYGKQKASEKPPVIHEQTNFLTEQQQLNHYLDAAIANLQKVAPLYESVQTQDYVGEIMEAISELKK